EVGVAVKEAYSGEPGALELARLGLAGFDLGAERAQAVPVALGDVALALVELLLDALQRVVEIALALLEHEDELAGELDRVVRAGGVERGVVGGGVRQRIGGSRACLGGVGAGGELAERVERHRELGVEAEEESRERLAGLRRVRGGTERRRWVAGDRWARPSDER